jgi:hypothetical protein
MKTDVQGCSTCPIGKESFETFYSSFKKRNLVQYDYRHSDGELFTTIAMDVESARRKKEMWLKNKSLTVLGMKISELSTRDICEELMDLRRDLRAIEEYERGDIRVAELTRRTTFWITEKPKIEEAIRVLTAEKIRRNGN